MDIPSNYQNDLSAELHLSLPNYLRSVVAELLSECGYPPEVTKCNVHTESGGKQLKTYFRIPISV